MFMTQLDANRRPPMMRWADDCLLCVLLGFIVLRSTIIETPLISQSQTRLFLSSEIVSLLISSSVLGCMAVWVLISVLRDRLTWRRTGFGIALGVFIIAGILTAFSASNKRVAVTDLVTLATPMLSGVLLVQLLNSPAKIRLALLLILAVGVAATVQCLDQRMASNQTLIEDYETDPTAHLEKMGIEPDTMEHWMYEHRLYSKDIRGFLMTSNSAASFFLFAVFAGLGLCLQATGKKMSQEAIAALVCYLLTLAIVLLGLFLTQSKGGIGSFALGFLLLVILLVFGKTIWRHRRLFGTLTFLFIAAIGVLIISYGLGHGRLPGGNSMLVRWQYWVSAAAMTRDHLITGVGGGNFSDHYTHYKIPAASETVQNPHNWALSLLSQYGVFGLVAFLAAVLWPLSKVFHSFGSNEPRSHSEPDENKLWLGLLGVTALIMLFVRPVLVDSESLYEKVDVRAAAYIVLYLMPAVIIMVCFILLRVASVGNSSRGFDNRRLMMALASGMIAVLVHNLIDFAIFEPGTWSVFWLFIAILIAQIHNSAGPTDNVIGFDPPRRTGALAGLILIGIVYLMVVLLPPIRAEHLFMQAVGDDVRRVELIESAIAADSLSFKTAYQAGGMFCQAYQQQGIVKDKRFLEKAAEWAHIAAQRNPANFKPWRLLGRINVLFAEQAEGGQKEQYLQNAFGDLQQAIVCYPGSGKLHYNLANVAEQLGRNDDALAHYSRAVQIEDAYRAQFRVMYPERETVISRLGNTPYENAKANIEKLKKPLEKN
jgi:hypothetical protein